MKRQPNLRVDRVFPGVGRINLVSGATTKAEHTKRDALLVKLYDTGRLELLRAIKRRQLTINEVFSADRSERLGFVAKDVMSSMRMARTRRAAVFLGGLCITKCMPIFISGQWSIYEQVRGIARVRKSELVNRRA